MKKQLHIILYLLFVIAGYSQHLYEYDVQSILPSHQAGLFTLRDAMIDYEGFIWYTTTEGLHCFDGENVITYNDQYTRDTMYVSKEGSGFYYAKSGDGKRIWTINLKTYDLLCFDIETRSIIKYIEPKEGWFFTELVSDEHNNLFVLSGALDYTAYRRYQITDDTTGGVDLPMNSKIFDYAVYSDLHWYKDYKDIICVDSLGMKVTAYTDANLVYFSESRDLITYSASHSDFNQWSPQIGDFMPLKNLPSFTERRQYKIFDFGEEVWFVGQQLDLHLWNRKTNEVTDYSQRIIDVYREEENTIPVDRITSIIPTENGSYFIIGGHYIFLLTPKVLSYEDLIDPINSGKSSTSVRQITEDDRGNIYASYYTGVAIKKKGNHSFEDFRGTRVMAKAKESTYSLSSWNNKLIWNQVIFTEGIDSLDYVQREDIGSHVNHQLLGDTIWIFTWISNNLYKYDLKSGSYTLVAEGIHPQYLWTTSFLWDDQNEVFWLSTSNEGIIAIDKKGRIVREYPKELFFQSDNFKAIHELHLAGDTIWYGYGGGLGFINIKTKEIRTFSCPYLGKNGQPILRVVYSLYEKNSHEFLMGTSKGLVLFDRSSLTFSYLNHNHPLADKEFNRNSRFRSSDGTYYFGTTDGLFSFTDDEVEFGVKTKELNPPYIYQIKVIRDKSQKERNITSNLGRNIEIDLNPDESYVEIDFSFPNYESNISYEYRIGQDNLNWITTNERVTIPTLSPGVSRMEIRAINLDEISFSPSAHISINKAQYWYKHTWVIALFVLGVLGTITLYIRSWYLHRIRYQEQLAGLRTKISSDLHDDVGSILSGLAMQSEMLSYEVSDHQKAQLHEISTMSRDAMDRMRDTVWVIDSRKDKYENLMDRMRNYTEKNLNYARINHQFKVENIKGKDVISPEIRQNVYLIFKEAITNIIKHSNATEVYISMHKDADGFHLIIQDNGSILHEGSTSDGLGISNMKMRAEKIGGSLLIRKNDGFRVELNVREHPKGFDHFFIQ